MRPTRWLTAAILSSAAFIVPSPVTAATPTDPLVAAAFAGVRNPCAADETWVQPSRITARPDGGSVDEYDQGGGVTARTPLPPPGFDPLHASADDLASYGFPPRPDNPTDLNTWQADMAAWRPTPDLGECRTQAKALIYDNDIWAGWDADSTSSSTYIALQGDYHQPAKGTTSCSPSQEVSWIGLGGYHYPRLMQNGTGIDTSGNKYAWYEYLSATGGIAITKLPSVTVHSGDRIHLYLVHQTSGSGQTTFYVADNTTSTSQSKIINLGNTYFDGSSAEFIDERPSIGGIPTNLANFGTNNWTNAQVYTKDAVWHTLGSQTNVEFDMWDSSFIHYLAFPGALTSNTTFTNYWFRCS